MKITNPKNRYYQKALKIEIELGNEGRSAPETYPPTVDLHPEIIRYRNFRITGEENSELFFWVDFLFKSIPKLDIGLTLGSGTGKEAAYMQKKGYVKNWDSIDIVETFGNKLKEENSNTYICQDLNFTNLPEEKYDIIICFGVLHHIINIEELLYEINKALKKEGVFLVYEYVGESKWNFSSLKKNIIKESLENEFSYKFNYKKRKMSLRPLESIRSQEIPGILNFYFEGFKKYENIWNALLYPGINIASLITNFNKTSDFIDKQVELFIRLNEKYETQDNLIKTELIGLYTKNIRLKTKAESIPWTHEETKIYLDSSGFIKAKIHSKVRKFVPTLLIKIYKKINGRI